METKESVFPWLRETMPGYEGVQTFTTYPGGGLLHSPSPVRLPTDCRAVETTHTAADEGCTLSVPDLTIM